MLRPVRKTLLAAVLATFIISYILHHPEIHGRIYSDIVAFWTRPLVYNNRIPYIETSFEYPPIAGLVTYLSATIGRNVSLYYTVFSIFLLIGYLVTVLAADEIAQSRDIKEHVSIMFLALAPSLYFYLVYNFDIMFTAFLMLSFLYLERDRSSLSAVFFGLTALTKLMNLILLPIFLMFIKGWRKRIYYILTSLGVFAVVNLALFAVNPKVMAETYLHHVRWGLENAWFIVFFPSEDSWDTAKLFSMFLVGYGLMKVYLSRFGDLYERSFMAFSAFLLGTYVFTPQMVLWLLPFLAIIGRFSPAFFIMELANVGIILTWFTSPEPQKFGSIPQYLAILRAAALFYLLIEVYVEARRRGWSREED